jgi:hypothetical protein
VRWQKDLEHVQKTYQRQKPLFAALPKLRPFPLSVRCSDLEQGFKLWELHLQRAQAHVQALGDRAIEVKYEDFLANPFEHLRTLANFAELNADESRLREITSQVKDSRAQAYKKNPELLAFSRSVNERLERYGYS